MQHTITIRPETPADYYAVELLSRDSGLGYCGEDTDAALHVHKTRRHKYFLPELSFVAALDGKPAGMIMFTKSRLAAKGRVYNDTFCLQVLRVAPWAQCRGVGSALVRHTVPLAKAMGCRAILFHGNPDFYPRLGFRPAFEFGVGDKYLDHFHCMPLYEGALDGVERGVHREANIPLPKWRARLYNRRFPPPDMSWLKSIDFLLDQLEPPTRKAVESLKLAGLYQMCRQSERSVAALPGIDARALETIRRVMRECNYGWGRGTIQKEDIAL